MGLANGFSMGSAQTDSIPILFVAAAASLVSFLRSLIFPDEAAAAAPSPLAVPAVHADFFGSNSAFPYRAGGRESRGEDCIICLSNVNDGEKVRRLSCCHVFHCDCLDGWLDQMKLTCPLCRCPLLVG